MSSKGLLFIGLFGFCVVGAFFLPHLGIYGYLADYCINPSGQWWGQPFANMGLRVSFTLALATMAGIVLQWKKLRFGDALLYPQEKTLLAFLALVWLLFFVSPETVGRYGSVDHPAFKLTKIVIFTLMMTHVITDLKKLNGLFWVLATVGLILGIKAWQTPYGRFVRGRLEGIGGADFDEANFFAAFMAAILPIIGIQFLRSKHWLVKLYALACGAFTANAIILCRSRGAFLGVAMGAVAALWFAPKKLRKKIILLLILGGLGGLYLSDAFFIERILTITTDQQSMDSSTSSRIELWKAGAKMVANNPIGIGPGNWYQTIGKYIPEYEGKDSHSTYVKCAAELGVVGISLFLFLLWQAYGNLKKVHDGAVNLVAEKAEDFNQFYFALVVSLVVILTCGIAITMIYIEVVWLLLMLPICLRRAYDNHIMGEVQAGGRPMV
ncbi:O-antigen ligase family protein [Desulfoprunum benzoelyticum]|uniref:O-antigen ligase n=1 Tax=Desulfoprunum benzoelyticum TaxID=1506996 RepID=A0A840UZK8_9BACT|nr:O-antigen ligase family protein [Desulfoprunum benzoelyticum]MBB5346980.1 O-antigen ligase [Desulfoprunum benzoelyticum]MBM9531002.1 O-antigen ligase family protein [Desulfoprunum benzoelyticum]